MHRYKIEFEGREDAAIHLDILARKIINDLWMPAHPDDDCLDGYMTKTWARALLLQAALTGRKMEEDGVLDAMRRHIIAHPNAHMERYELAEEAHDAICALLSDNEAYLPE